jgi:hypothetical protein
LSPSARRAACPPGPNAARGPVRREPAGASRTSSSQYARPLPALADSPASTENLRAAAHRCSPMPSPRSSANRRRAPRRRPLDRGRTSLRPAHLAEEGPARLLRWRIRLLATARVDPRTRRPSTRRTQSTCPGALPTAGGQQAVTTSVGSSAWEVAERPIGEQPPRYSRRIPSTTPLLGEQPPRQRCCIRAGVGRSSCRLRPAAGSATKEKPLRG